MARRFQASIPSKLFTVLRRKTRISRFLWPYGNLACRLVQSRLVLFADMSLVHKASVVANPSIAEDRSPGNKGDVQSEIPNVLILDPYRLFHFEMPLTLSDPDRLS